MNRLQQASEGNALKAVYHFLFELNNVPKIMERLEENVGRSSQVYEEYLKTLTKTKAGSSDSVVEISDTLDSLVAHVSVMERQTYLTDFRLVYIYI